MSNSIFADLYNGRLIQWERSRPQDPDYTPICRKISEIKVYLEEHMSKEDYGRFEEMQNLYVKASAIEDVNLFEYGFSMGILLMIEVFNFKERVSSNEE